MFRAVQATFPPGTAAPPITKVVGKMWREMTPGQKQPYVDAQLLEATQRIKDRAELIASRPVGPGSVSKKFGCIHLSIPVLPIEV